MTESFQCIVESIQKTDHRYREDAYAFLMEALTYTQKKFKSSKHVSGEEILEGIKQLLIKKYGPMALTVLNYWGITTTEDFGNMVFNLVKRKVLSKTPEDNIEVFRDAYDLESVFKEGYRKDLVKKIARMRSI